MMSTRSGKRIHTSIHENTLNREKESIVIKAERKTRSKRLKENCPGQESPPKLKKRNYVAYPNRDDVNDQTTVTEIIHVKNTPLRRTTLKELNGEVENGTKSLRKSRRVRQQNGEELPDENEIAVQAEIKGIIKKKTKKNKVNKTDYSENVSKEQIVEKKKNKKRKVRHSHSMVVEDLEDKSLLNKSNASIETFHSAAGSPVHDDKHNPAQEVTQVKENITMLLNEKLASIEEITIADPKNKKKKKSKKGKHSVETSETIHPGETGNKTIEKLPTVSSNRRETPSSKSVKSATFVKNEELLATTVERQTYEQVDNNDVYDPSIEIELNEPRISDNLEGEENNRLSIRNSKVFNSTFENTGNSGESHNSTFEVDMRRRSSIRKSMVPGDKADGKRNSICLDATFDKDQTSSKLDSTYDKNDNKLDTTFDKDDAKISLDSKNSLVSSDSKNSLISSDSKNSLISSDADTNVAHNKSDISQISITSDESKTENIVNTTPLLIESSIEESAFEKSLIISVDSPSKPQTPLKREGTFTKDSPKTVMTPHKNSRVVTNSPKPQTPLKREGTFTKESPKVETPKPRVSSERTPTKPMSLPSPGCTPFTFTKSGPKTMLNVTRSIEKTRRSSLAEVVPRSTKVMFCSPVDIPVVTEKKKIIKSNLKGSNKSFVFDDSVSEVRPTARKRSLTHGDAEDVRAKRKRLAEDMQVSVDRLSRPRTSSATAKLTQTPSKKAPTPSKTKPPSRTKLPNFAALHQRRFEKMESLDECQERKAKRARQLLTPTGSVNIIEQTSPKDQPKENPKTTSKKPETPSKTLRPPSVPQSFAYTRFGFKLNLDVNPFSVPSKKVEGEPIKNTPNGLKREPTLPSLAGATCARKEMAKQSVMREKSFTDKRNLNRNENRNILKGVRTNRRFDLQMKMRNIVG